MSSLPSFPLQCLHLLWHLDQAQTQRKYSLSAIKSLNPDELKICIKWSQSESTAQDFKLDRISFFRLFLMYHQFKPYTLCEWTNPFWQPHQSHSNWMYVILTSTFLILKEVMQ